MIDRTVLLHCLFCGDLQSPDRGLPAYGGTQRTRQIDSLSGLTCARVVNEKKHGAVCDLGVTTRNVDLCLLLTRIDPLFSVTCARVADERITGQFVIFASLY